MKMRKSEQIVRIANKIADEIEWNRGDEKEVEKWRNLARFHQTCMKMDAGGMALIPALENEIVRLGIAT